MTDELSILESALRYEAELGWSISACCPPDHAGMGDWHFPCSTPGKRPWHKWKIHQDVRTTASEIRDRWRQHPTSNAGVFLGPVSGETGIIRVDVDGERGVELLSAKSNGDIPYTPEFRSGKNGGAGLGLIFAIPRGVTLKTTTDKGDGEHEELRFQAKGAQTVLPPSIHPDGGKYFWLPGKSPFEIPVATAPDWLVDALKEETSDEYSAACAEELRLTEALEPYRREHRYSEADVARMALAAIKTSRAADYDDWLHVGMALHSVNDDSLLLDWTLFSRACPEKYRDGECAAKWASFTRNGKITLGTLVKMAKDDGWHPPWEGNGHSGNWNSGSVFRGGDEICNAVVTKAEKEKHVDPLPMAEIIGRAKQKTRDWPRRVGSVLFVDGGANNITFLEKQAALFGYFGGACGIPSKFIPDPSCHTKAEVFEEFRRTATAYEAIERFPHEPIMSGHYYSCGIPKPGNGDCLRELLSRFNPATEIDRDLILSLFATLIWGGRGGTRPAFCITSDDGRGAGKTSVINGAGYLVGGALEIIANEDAARIKTRLLSPEGLLKRVVLLDNAKARCLSWADLEGMITAPSISGHRLFTGEMARPNVITWCVTMNGGSYSTDLAQRSVFIKVAKPTYAGNWEESLREFMDGNREAIFADLIGFLRGPRTELSRHSRWGAWERDILCRLPEPADAQRVIIERQNAADAEVEESEVIGDYFRQQITAAGYATEFVRVFIPSNIARDWLAAATGEKFTTIGASRTLSQLIDEGKLQCIERCKSRAGGRGFVWMGSSWNPDDAVCDDLDSRGTVGNGDYQCGR